MSAESDESDRRRPTMPSLHQPAEAALLRARVGEREIVQVGRILELTDRTLVVEVDDAAHALALSLAPEIAVELSMAGSQRTMLARPGRRTSDIASSRRVELVMEDVD